MLGPFPSAGVFSVNRATAVAGTAFVSLIPPYPGPPALIYRLRDGKPSWFGPNIPRTVLETVIYTTGTTLHQIGVMRPFNFTFTSTAAPINQAVINLVADPRAYSTHLHYPSPGNRQS